jgi:hypothetical protein
VDSQGTVAVPSSRWLRCHSAVPGYVQIIDPMSQTESSFVNFHLVRSAEEFTWPPNEKTLEAGTDAIACAKHAHAARTILERMHRPQQ